MGFSTHTWVVGDAWPVTDANSFIRDALISVRRYQNSSGQIYGDSVVTSTTSPTQIGVNHYNLMSSTPDEAYRMVVVSSIICDSTVGGSQPAGYGVLRCYDQTGAQIGVTVGGNVSSNTQMPLALIAGGSYAAGSNNGFSLQTTPNTSTTIGWTATTVVFFMPQV